MLTQCPECQTVFRATLAQLEAAAGRVRCGHCNGVFDALEAANSGDDIPSLDDDSLEVEIIGGGPVKDEELEPEPQSPRHAEELAEFEESTPVQSDADLIPIAPRAVFAEEDSDPLADTAEHEIIDVKIESTPSIEITMEGERIDIDGVQFAAEAEEFAEQARGELAELHREFQRMAQEEAAEEEAQRERVWLDTPSTSDDAQGHAASAFASRGIQNIAGDSASGAGYAAASEHVASSSARFTFGREPPADSAGEVSDDEVSALLTRQPHRRRTWLWATGSVFVIIVMFVQLIHFNRDTLARNALIGEPLMRMYQALGLDLSPMWNLQAYELRQWGATADSHPGGALRVRASLFNKAQFAQPYPLLRLSLQDRFGGQLGARDLTPEEYLPGARTGQLLAAGQRIDAEIALVDPGKDAVGFEIDVCLRAQRASTGGAGLKTVCANAPPR